MARKAEQHKCELVDKARARHRPPRPRPGASAVQRFVRQFYANVSPDDLVGETPESLYGAALSLWNHGAEAPADVAKVRVFNPRADEHGWRSGHTVVEIVNDDMPFLVDSVDRGAHPPRSHRPSRHPSHRQGQPRRRGPSIEKGEPHDESFMQVRINEQTGSDKLEEIRRSLEHVLADVRAAVVDWRAMRAKIADVVGGTRQDAAAAARR